MGNVFSPIGLSYLFVQAFSLAGPAIGVGHRVVVVVDELLDAIV